MLKLRSVRVLLVGLSVAIAVGLSLMLHLPASAFQAKTDLAQVIAGQQQPTSASLPATVRNPATYGTGLKRTLDLLASSTPTHRNTVRILFYGQSITKQDWWLEVVNRLQAQFPDAHLIVENRAIGGFASPLLVKAAEHDLYSFYPDLMIFHVYGDEKNYESIMARTKQRTIAEIALMSDFIDWLPGEPSDRPADDLKRYQWHNQHGQWLAALAAKYGCELIDIRTPWEDYLKQNHLASSVMRIENDGHLNDRGNRLMAKLVGDHLLQSPIPTTNPNTASVKEYPENALRWQNGRVKLTFEGNRVDIVTRTSELTSAIAGATVLIDGKRPSQLPSLYHLTRPSDAFQIDVPAILQVQAKAPLQVEDWSVVISEIGSDPSRFKFQVYGSQTGFDGEGVSTERFVSRSRQVVIEPQDWWLDDVVQWTKRPFPKGFQIRWRIEPLFQDEYVPARVTDSSRETATTLAQGLQNTRHTLELISYTGQPLSLESIRVYRPDSSAARID
jgi:hypothetical protein